MTSDDVTDEDVEQMLDSIYVHLTDPAVTGTSAAVERHRYRQRIVLATGALNRGWLCWLCAAHTVARQGPQGEKYVVCRQCLAIDRVAARLAGEEHLTTVRSTPVTMTYNSPIERLRVDDRHRTAWRRALVDQMAEHLHVQDRYDFPLVQWRSHLGWTWRDCALRYVAWVDVIAPELAHLDRRITDPTYLARTARRSR